MKLISNLSPIYIALVISLALVVSLYLYLGKEEKLYSKTVRRALIFLRTTGLTLIGILFIGIFLQTNKTKIEKPILINLIDNSMSMKNYADSTKVNQYISNYLQKIQEQYSDKFTIKNYTVGANFKQLDSIDFREDKTNLSRAFSTISEQFYGNNIGAVTLISDGNYNEGDHPIYATNNLNYTPIFTLAVGDTVTKKDIVVRAIQSNDFVFLNNSFPVEALVEVKKINSKIINVHLMHQGKRLKSQSISITPNTTFYKVNFEVEAKEKGVRYYEIVVDNASGEYTYKNNKQGFYIEVIDDARKILLLASAPHPDIAAVKSALEKEKNNLIDVKLVDEWKGTNILYDLVIFHNPLNTNSSLLTKLIENKTPVLAILGAQSNFKQSHSILGMNFSSLNQLDDNVPFVNENFNLFELTPETKKQIKNFPPLRSVFGRMKLSPTAQILLFQGVGEVKKEDAQIFFNVINTTKIGVIQGEGLWRWKLANYRTLENTSAFDEIIQKAAQYLTVKKNNSPFRVSVPKKSNSNEPVIIKAEVLDASMHLTTKGNVDFKLVNTNNIQQVFDFSVVNNYYSLNIGKLAPGNYKWIASTKINEKNHSLNGELIVESNSIELVDNTSNYGVLNQLSTQTNGMFFPIAHYQKLLKEFSLRNDIRPIETQEKNIKNLIDYWWIIVLIVLAFGSEWFIKKYNGSY